MSGCVRLCSACLRSWLEQDTSCPTCRTSLSDLHTGQQAVSNEIPQVPAEQPVPNARRHRARRTNRFHFDGKVSTEHKSFHVEGAGTHVKRVKRTLCLDNTGQDKLCRVEPSGV